MALHLVREGETEIESVEDALREYEALESQVKVLQERQKNLKAQIIGAMAFQERKRVEVPSAQEGKRYRATYSAPERMKVDQAGIEKTLGARRFARVSDRVLNAEKLMAAVDKGTISSDLVVPFLKKEPGTPSLRFYLVDEQKESDDAGPAEG